MTSQEKKLTRILDKHQKYLDAIHDGIVEGTEEGIKKGAAKGAKKAAWDVLKEECLPQGFMNVSGSDIEDIVRYLSELVKNIDGDITGAANKIIERNVKQYRDRLVVDIIKKFRGQKPELAFVLELVTQRENKVGELISERLPNNPISSGIVKGVETALKKGIDRSYQHFENELKDKLEGVESSKGESQETKKAQKIEQIKEDSKSIVRDAVAKVVEEIVYKLLRMLLKRVIAKLRNELKEKSIHELERKLRGITRQKLEQSFSKSVGQFVEELGKDHVDETNLIKDIDRTFGNSAKKCLKSQIKWLTPLKTLAITVIILGGAGGAVFAWPNPTHTLSVSVSPPEAGTVYPLSGEFDSGTLVTLIASPTSDDWVFDHWGGNASGVSPTRTINIDSDKSVTAYFTTEIPATTNSPPVAEFTWGEVAGRVSFTDLTTDDGEIVSWYWDFGDGETGPEQYQQNPTHDYSEGGKYTVILVVTDNLGVQDRIERDIEISGPVQ